jgi:general secretion pathway protein D
VLRLRDGETQALAGLIQDQERSSINKIPGLGDLPVLGRLFSDHSDNNSKSEIILLITPHVVRNLNLPDLNTTEFQAGTETSLGGLGMRSGVIPPPPVIQQAPAAAAPAAPTTPQTLVPVPGIVPLQPSAPAAPQPNSPAGVPATQAVPAVPIPAGAPPASTSPGAPAVPVAPAGG